MSASSLPSSPLILVVVGGSMAAVKAPAVLRRFRERGATVQCIATPAALEFITELSLATAANGPIATDEAWFLPRPDALHLVLAKADVTVIVSASAELLAGAAGGHASTLALATLLSVRGPVLWIPAMNETMWQHPAVQANVQQLKVWGHQFLGPVVGPFGTQGEGQGIGRMAEPEEIAEATLQLLNKPVFNKPVENPELKQAESLSATPLSATPLSATPLSTTPLSATPLSTIQLESDLAGLKVVVSAGPTREYLDPVRFISNPSSGKMGYAVAEEAKARGAQVVLVSGPVNLAAPTGMKLIYIESALELREAVLAESGVADIVVMTAAVADYRATTQATEKQAKVSGDVTIHLTPNPDILAELGRDQANHGGRVLVGFAMETHAGIERAAGKAKRKNADFILLNYPTREGTAFGGDDNEVTLVRADESFEAWPRITKREVARCLLDEALKVYQNRKDLS